MKIASSMAELEKMIMDEIYTAMSVARNKSEQDTKTEVQSFYSQEIGRASCRERV